MPKTLTLKQVIALALVLVVVAGAVVLWREGKAKGVLTSSMGALESRLNAYKTDKAELVGLLQQKAKEEAIELAKRDKLAKEVTGLKSDISKLTSENITLKGKLATMPDNDIVLTMAKYIGKPNVALLGIGSFSLTRPGAENTVSIFFDNDTNVAKILKLNDIIAKKEDAETSFKESLAKCNEKVALVQVNAKKCDDALVASQKVNSDLKRALFWKKVETWGERGLIFLAILGRILGII
jgi:hypothetical protein